MLSGKMFSNIRILLTSARKSHLKVAAENLINVKCIFKTTQNYHILMILVSSEWKKIYEISCVIRGLGTQLQRQIVKNMKNGRLKSSYKIVVFYNFPNLGVPYESKILVKQYMGGLGPLFTSVWGFILDPHFPLK